MKAQWESKSWSEHFTLTWHMPINFYLLFFAHLLQIATQHFFVFLALFQQITNSSESTRNNLEAPKNLTKFNWLSSAIYTYWTHEIWKHQFSIPSLVNYLFIIHWCKAFFLLRALSGAFKYSNHETPGYFRISNDHRL